MSQADEFHNLDRPVGGIARELAPGLTTRIFPGEGAMLSVVTIATGASGTLHSHPEERWGVLLEGTAVRVQGGEEIAVRKGDFRRTPGGVPHTMRAAPEGSRVLDIFSPPRPEYRVPGQGFGTGGGGEGRRKWAGRASPGWRGGARSFGGPGGRASPPAPNEPGAPSPEPRDGRHPVRPAEGLPRCSSP